MGHSNICVFIIVSVLSLCPARPRHLLTFIKLVLFLVYRDHCHRRTVNHFTSSRHETDRVVLADVRGVQVGCVLLVPGELSGGQRGRALRRRSDQVGQPLWLSPRADLGLSPRTRPCSCSPLTIHPLRFGSLHFLELRLLKVLSTVSTCTVLTPKFHLGVLAAVRAVHDCVSLVCDRHHSSLQRPPRAPNRTTVLLSDLD